MATMSVDQIMCELRAERKRLRIQAATDLAGGHPENLPVWETVETALEQKSQYDLIELLCFSDARFVDNAYRVILGRAPDPEGGALYLAALRDGRLTKVEVLGHLRWSSEGLARSVHIDGLLIPYKLQQWKRRRFAGPILRWVHAFLRLGSLPARLELQEFIW